jgi:hypothetical protein
MSLFLGCGLFGFEDFHHFLFGFGLEFALFIVVEIFSMGNRNFQQC